MTAVLDLSKTSIVPQVGRNSSDVYRLTVETYDRMIEQGLFDEDERVELLDGILIKTSPKGVRHANAIRRIDQKIDELLGDTVIFSAQDPIRLDDFSEPEPDIVLLKPPIETYDERHPEPDDIFLIIEIADTSLERDRAKALNYARNSIPQYLILNLVSNEVEEYLEPSPDGYRSKFIHARSQTFSLVGFPEVEISVNDLIPPKQLD